MLTFIKGLSFVVTDLLLGLLVSIANIFTVVNVSFKLPVDMRASNRYSVVSLKVSFLSDQFRVLVVSILKVKQL